MKTLLDDKLACTILCLTSSHSMAKIVPKLIRLTLMCAYFTPHYTHPISGHGKNTATLVSEWAVPENIHDVSKMCIDDNTIYDANHVNTRVGTRKTLALTSLHRQAATMYATFFFHHSRQFTARAHVCECVNFFPLGMILNSIWRMINDIIRFDDVVVAGDVVADVVAA